MARVDITRELGTKKNGKRGFIYTITIRGRTEGEKFESPIIARKAAAVHLKRFAHASEIVEMWTDGKVYRATDRGSAVLVGDAKPASPEPHLCSVCGVMIPRVLCTSKGECRACVNRWIAVLRERNKKELESE